MFAAISAGVEIFEVFGREDAIELTEPRFSQLYHCLQSVRPDCAGFVRLRTICLFPEPVVA